MKRMRVIGCASLAAMVIATGYASASAAASPPPGFAPGAMQQPGHRAADHTAVLCKSREWEWLRSGMVAYNDVFGRHYSECISVRPAGFRITRARTGWIWGAYPDVFIGCEYSVCSKTALPQRPIRDFTHIMMTLYTRFGATAGNDATDWWFTRTRPGRSRSHPNGAELMVWLAWRNVPMRNGYYVTLLGQRWYVEHWIAYADHTHWQYIQIRWLGRHQHPSVHLNMLRIIQYVERLGWLRPSWYPSSFDAGFEVVNGGVGSRILKYAVSIRAKQ